MENKKVRIIVADDHQTFLEIVCREIEKNDDFEVIDQVQNGKELIQSFSVNRPDLVITDCRMPVMAGYEACQAIRIIEKNAKVIFMSQDTDDIYIYKVYKAGGMGLVDKNKIYEELNKAIMQVINGEKYFGGIDIEKKIEELEVRYKGLVWKGNN